MTYMDRYHSWCEAGLPADVQLELRSIAGNEEELKSRFGGDLQFGTAGMRGIMGAGSNRLNRYTVRRAAMGMAAWLSGTDLPQKAAIGYDSRHNSQLFAEVCAVAFAEKGIEVHLYDRLAPTPMLRTLSVSLAAAAASSFPPATMPVLTTVSSATARTAAR